MLIEFLGTWLSTQCRFGLQSIRLTPPSSQQHHTPAALCTSGWGKTQTMRSPTLSVSCTARGHALLAHNFNTVCYALCFICLVPSGILHPCCGLIAHLSPCISSIAMRHPGSRRYTIIVWMSCTIQYPNGMMLTRVNMSCFWTQVCSYAPMHAQVRNV